MAWVTPPVAGGLGFEFSRALTSISALMVLSQAILWAIFSNSAVLLLSGVFVIIVVARNILFVASAAPQAIVWAVRASSLKPGVLSFSHARVVCDTARAADYRRITYRPIRSGA